MSKIKLDEGMRVRRFIEGEQFLGTLTHRREIQGTVGFHIDVDGKKAKYVQFFPEKVIRADWEIL